MPLVQLHILEGRTPETKKRLIAEVTEAVSRTLGAPAESVRVLLYELPKTHWAVGGLTMDERQTGAAPPQPGDAAS